MNMVSPAEFARIFNLSRVTVYTLIKAGKIPAIKLGYVWRIDTDEIKPENLKGDANNNDEKRFYPSIGFKTTSEGQSDPPDEAR